MFYIPETLVFCLHTMSHTGTLSLNIALQYIVVTSKHILSRG
jgi:hypothetical protein